MPRRLALVTALLAAGGLGATPGLAQDGGGSRTEVRTLSAEGASPARVITTREESAGRTVERTVVEGTGVDGDATVLSETLEETVSAGARTVERRRQEYAVGPGGRRLVETVEERTEERADGGRLTVREHTEPDLNGRARTTRREREETVADGDGVFRTRIDITEASIGGLAQTQVIERVEQRDGDELVAQDSTTYTDPTGRGTLQAVERRVLTREPAAAGGARSVEVVYRADDNGNLVQRERIVRRERTGPGGGQVESEEIFTPAVNGARGSLRLERRVESVRTGQPGGGEATTRTVSEARDGRMRVVERVIERAVPDGAGNIVIERETQRVDVNGRFQTVSTTRAREPGR